MSDPKIEKPKQISTQKQVEMLRDEVRAFVVETGKTLDFLLSKIPVKSEEISVPVSSSRQEIPGPNKDLIPNQVEAPVPPRFREVVDEVLGTEFGIKCYNFKDNTDFQVDILVPLKYTSTPKEERDPDFVDIRSKVINRALGEIGVRDWVMKIRTNLTKYFTSKGIASPFTN